MHRSDKSNDAKQSWWSVRVRNRRSQSFFIGLELCVASTSLVLHGMPRFRKPDARYDDFSNLSAGGDPLALCLIPRMLSVLFHDSSSVSRSKLLRIRKPCYSLEVDLISASTCPSSRLLGNLPRPPLRVSYGLFATPFEAMAGLLFALCPESYLGPSHRSIRFTRNRQLYSVSCLYFSISLVQIGLHKVVLEQGRAVNPNITLTGMDGTNTTRSSMLTASPGSRRSHNKSHNM